MIDQDTLKRIEDLHRLKNEGILSEEEFEQAKQRLLFGNRTPTRPLRAPRQQPDGPEPFITPLMEDHWKWITRPLRRYAEFNGRSSRREYWMFQLVPVALFVGTLILFLGSGHDVYGGVNGFGMLTLFLFAIAMLGLIVPQLAVQVRRFRDQDRSPWLVLLNLVPYVGPVIVMVFMIIEGTDGDNQYGPDPRAT